MTHGSKGAREERFVPSMSVIIPLFNKRDHVRRTVLRVLAQDYDDFEVIVIDDGSTDGSVDQIADLDDQRLRILRQSNAGPGAARNLGIAQARNDWIAFLDADDSWYPDHLDELARAILTYPAAGMASTAYLKRSASPELPPRRADPGALRQTNFFAACRRRNIVWTSALAIRRELLDQLGGFRPSWPGEDTDMWIRAGLRTPLVCSSRVTAIYSLDTGGISDTVATRRRTGERGQGQSEDIPVITFLRETLRNREYRRLHGPIRTYIDARLLSVAKNALFEGNRRGARAALARVSRRSSGRYVEYQALALLPEPLFGLIHAAWHQSRRAAPTKD